MTICVSAITARTVALCLKLDQQTCYFLASSREWTLYEGDELVRHGASSKSVVFIEQLKPDTDYVFKLDDGTQCLFRTLDCTGLVDIRGFGALETNSDNHDAIMQAVAKVPSGGTLLIPAGCWRSSPIFLKSDFTLYLEEGATLQAVDDRNSFPIIASHDAHGQMLGSWEGEPAPIFASLITALDCQNVTVSGAGHIDGGGANGDWWSWPKGTRNSARRARTIFLNGCTNVTISGVTVQNSPSWTIHPVYCQDLTVSAVSILNPPDSPNTDGLNPESCSSVRLEGIHFSVGDDCIAIKAGKRGPVTNNHLKPCEDIQISHCLMERGHGGVVIGSEMSGSVRRVRIENCEFLKTDRGLRLKTRRGRGGEISNIVMKSCRMDGVDTAIVANAYYFCDADGKSDYVQSRAFSPPDISTPHISDIHISDMDISNVRIAVGVFLGLPEAPIKSISLSDIRAGFDASTKGDVPVMALQVGDYLHHTFITEFADLRTNQIKIAGTEHPGHRQAETC